MLIAVVSERAAVRGGRAGNDAEPLSEFVVAALRSGGRSRRDICRRPCPTNHADRSALHEMNNRQSKPRSVR
jgi:hypothetical protein